jgi:hypothetical protein
MVNNMSAYPDGIFPTNLLVGKEIYDLQNKIIVKKNLMSVLWPCEEILHLDAEITQLEKRLQELENVRRWGPSGKPRLKHFYPPGYQYDLFLSDWKR